MSILQGTPFKKFTNALATPPLQAAPSNTGLVRSYYIESAKQEWWKPVPPFLSNGLGEFNICFSPPTASHSPPPPTTLPSVTPYRLNLRYYRHRKKLPQQPGPFKQLVELAIKY